jgi:hypothetical protein
MGEGYRSDCGMSPGMVVYGNTVATPGASVQACGTFLEDWVRVHHCGLLWRTVD